MTRLTSRLLTLVVFIAAASSFAQKPLDTRLRVASPDGQIVFILSDAPHTHAVNPASSDLRYSIDFRTKWLMDESSLGLKVAGQPPLGPGMKQVHLETPPRDDAHVVSPGTTKTALLREPPQLRASSISPMTQAASSRSRNPRL